MSDKPFRPLHKESLLTHIIDSAVHTHELTYNMTRHTRTDVFSPNYSYMWMMRADCTECGWYDYTTRNCIQGTSECSITQEDKNSALSNHHLGRGFYSTKEGLFFVDKDFVRMSIKFTGGKMVGTVV